MSKTAEILKEVTEWEWPNHTYLVSAGGKLLAYVKEGTKEAIKLSGNIAFDKRYRKFVKVENPELSALAITEKGAGIEVKSESGKTYYITKGNKGLVCNCVGFGFRGKCKHIEQFNKESEEK